MQWAVLAGFLGLASSLFGTILALDWVGAALAVPAGPLPANPAAAGVLLLLMLGMYGAPVAVAVAVGRLVHWWHAGLVCQGIGTVTGLGAVALMPDRIGLTAAVAIVSAWTAAGAVCAGLCAARRWWAGRPAEPSPG